ncbi:MAG: type II secretion system protein [Nitrospira sp.]|nr:MAG: type II secretion system protein [Nitrospira sp.]
MRWCDRQGARGFTLIELLVVLAIISTLLTLAMPRYVSSLQKSKEVVLKEDLWIMREALDKYYGDVGKYPDRLEDLAVKKYLRAIPIDPITEKSSTWLVIPPSDPEKGGVYDVKSGAEGNGTAGSPYSEW